MSLDLTGRSGRPEYVYVASSWRNPMQPGVCVALRAAGIEHYDFKNPEGGTGFSWRQVKTNATDVDPTSPQQGDITTCECGEEISFQTFRSLGFWEPDWSPNDDPVCWRHMKTGYSGDFAGHWAKPATTKPKGSDWEQVGEYLRMIEHPRALEGYAADFGAMQRADALVMVLPCGKSAHLELGWATGAGKRTAILMEDPVEPELMYRGVDYLADSLLDLLGWLGVKD